MTIFEAGTILAALFPDRYITAQLDVIHHSETKMPLICKYGIYVARKSEEPEDRESWFYSEKSIEDSLLQMLRYFFTKKEEEKKCCE